VTRLKKRHKVAAAGWTDDKVRALSTEIMLERLAGIGVVVSTDAFVAQARAEHAASAVAEAWRAGLGISPRDVRTDDFLGRAARVLWERLLPERPSFEMLDERMQAGYAAFWGNDVVGACDHWLAVWEGFRRISDRR
jgi:hypothetical protein